MYTMWDPMYISVESRSKLLMLMFIFRVPICDLHSQLAPRLGYCPKFCAADGRRRRRRELDTGWHWMTLMAVPAILFMTDFVQLAMAIWWHRFEMVWSYVDPWAAFIILHISSLFAQGSHLHMPLPWIWFCNSIRCASNVHLLCKQ